MRYKNKILSILIINLFYYGIPFDETINQNKEIWKYSVVKKINSETNITTFGTPINKPLKPDEEPQFVKELKITNFRDFQIERYKPLKLKYIRLFNVIRDEKSDYGKTYKKYISESSIQQKFIAYINDCISDYNKQLTRMKAANPLLIIKTIESLNEDWTGDTYKLGNDTIVSKHDNNAYLIQRNKKKHTWEISNITNLNPGVKIENISDTAEIYLGEIYNIYEDKCLTTDDVDFKIDYDYYKRLAANKFVKFLINNKPKNSSVNDIIDDLEFLLLRATSQNLNSEKVNEDFKKYFLPLMIK